MTPASVDGVEEAGAAASCKDARPTARKVCMVDYTSYLGDARPQREATTLVRQGHQVDFIGLKEKGRPSAETVDGVRIFRLRQSRYRGASGARYVWAYVKFLCGATAKMMALFRKERYDVIYLHTMPDFIVFAGLLPKLLGARIVLNIRDMMPELYMSKFGIGARHPLIRFLAFQEQLSIRLADKVICVHDPHRDVLVKRGADPAKITILPNVPDPAVFRRDASRPKTEDGFRIVYHGTIARRLGLDLAVRAFAKALKKCPGARFEIYGEGDSGDELVAQIKASGMEESVYFSGKAFPVEDIAKMVQGAALGLIPNRRDPATEYMLPVKLLEYAYLGIPVVAPRLLAIQYYFDPDQVEYYEPEDVDGLADAICRMYSDSARRAQLAHNAADFFKKNSWDALSLDLYNVVNCW